ncbi:MAG TPA: DUF2478 domain-containing protein [Caulobacteraceae bacterium]|nr:DUF2478 domain-containing protein [Caulobacteraceae bacterium]
MQRVKPIAVVQGAASSAVQELLRQFVAGLASDVRVAGVIEDPDTSGEGPCSAGDLRSLSDGRRFAIMQDLGADAVACRLDSEGVVTACEAVQRGVAAGCDLVVLSKFGKIEAERSGLAPAFADAIERGLPILTSMAPRFGEAWERFAAPLYVILPPDLAAIEAWWRAAGAGLGAPEAATASSVG